MNTQQNKWLVKIKLYSMKKWGYPDSTLLKSERHLPHLLDPPMMHCAADMDICFIQVV